MEKLLQKNIIQFLQAHIKLLGFRPVIHFELEGCYASNNKDNVATLNFEAVNSLLFSHHIDGELVPEYWTNQWEYVSNFNGQSPLKEAENPDPRTTDDHFLIEIITDKPVAALKKLLKDSGAVEINEVKSKDH